MKRIYLFNIVAWNYRKKIGFPVFKKENFAGLEAHRKRGKSARATRTPHHTLNEERSARFSAQHLSTLDPRKKKALFWLSEVNDWLTLRLKDINSLVRRTSLGKNNNKYKRIGYQWKPSSTSPMVQIWVLICWDWSSTITKIWDASGKRFVSDYSRLSETSTISSFR